MSERIELKNKFSFCPTCKAQLDGVTCCTNDGKRHPEKGDLSICAYCATILEFEAGGFVHEAPKSRLDDLKANYPESYQSLKETRSIILDEIMMSQVLGTNPWDSVELNNPKS